MQQKKVQGAHLPKHWLVQAGLIAMHSALVSPQGHWPGQLFSSLPSLFPLQLEDGQKPLAHFPVSKIPDGQAHGPQLGAFRLLGGCGLGGSGLGGSGLGGSRLGGSGLGGSRMSGPGLGGSGLGGSWPGGFGLGGSGLGGSGLGGSGLGGGDRGQTKSSTSQVLKLPEAPFCHGQDCKDSDIRAIEHTSLQEHHSSTSSEAVSKAIQSELPLPCQQQQSMQGIKRTEKHIMPSQSGSELLT